MQARFIFEDFEERDSKLVLALLKELPVIAVPELVFPLDLIMSGEGSMGKISRIDLMKGLIFRVNRGEIVPDKKSLVAYAIPVQTPIYTGVSSYDLRNIKDSKWNVTEFWGNDSLVVLETQRNRRKYEISLCAHEKYVKH